jgi:hypothetical protein
LTALAVVVVGICVLGGAATPAVASEVTSLDPKILAQVEHEFSQPRCGLSGAEGLRSELDALHITDPMPYLVRMATKNYPHSLSGLNVVAIALIGERPDPRALETLRRLYHGGALSRPAQLAAATSLAARFHDGSGLQLMTPRLRSSEVQVRADTLSYMGYVLTEKQVPDVLPLASDKDVYVLERFALVLSVNEDFRHMVLPRLVRELRDTPPDQAARIGFVLMLAGNTSGLSFVSDYLLGYSAPLDPASLRQFVSWCSSLSKKGHRLGIDGIVHLFELQPAGGRDEWLPSAIMAFAVATEFPRWWTHSEAENLRTAAEAVAWWRHHRDQVIFDEARGKFVHRSNS